jgi:small subunit ribosomal protein S2
LLRNTAADLEGVGSTQTRTNSFRPYQSLHRPKNAVDVTLSHLLASAAHLGHSTQLSNPQAFPFVYGTRNGINIIDVRQTITHLRRAAEVVRGVVERDGIVVFLGTTKGTERAVVENAKRLGRNGFASTKWVPGTFLCPVLFPSALAHNRIYKLGIISNAAKVFETSRLVPKDVDPRSTANAWDLKPFSFTPSLLICLSPAANAHAIREASRAHVPTIGITDTDVDPRAVTYAIPANDDSPRSVELIAGVLAMAGKEGLERRLARYGIFLSLLVFDDFAEMMMGLRCVERQKCGDCLGRGGCLEIRDRVQHRQRAPVDYKNGEYSHGIYPMARQSTLLTGQSDRRKQNLSKVFTKFHIQIASTTKLNKASERSTHGELASAADEVSPSFVARIRLDVEMPRCRVHSAVEARPTARVRRGGSVDRPGQGRQAEAVGGVEGEGCPPELARRSRDERLDKRS